MLVPRFLCRTLTPVLILASLVAAAAVPGDVVVATPASAEPRSVGLGFSDAASLTRLAAFLGRAVPDPDQGDAFTEVSANPDGTWSAITSTTPIRALGSDGEWAPIDLSLKVENGRVVPTNAPVEMSFSNGGDAPLAVAQPAAGQAGRELGWSWPETLPTPELDENTATYKDVVDGGDLVVIVNPTGFTHNIVLRERPTREVDFGVSVTTPGAQLLETPAGELAIVDGAGKELATAPAPVMWDSSTDAAGAQHVQPVEFSVDTRATSSTTPDELVLKPTRSFLSDPSTVYPVTVDPTFTLTPQYQAWATNEPGMTFVSTSDLQAGFDGRYKSRAYLKFNGDASWAASKIISAKLVLRNWTSGSCKSGAVRVARVTEPWTSSSISWSNLPGVTVTGAVDYSLAHGTNDTCPDADAEWTITDIVQRWADKTGPNYGLRVSAADEANANTFRRYRGMSSSSGVPRLVTTYSKRPVVGAATFAPGGPAVTSSLTPKITMMATDSDSPSLTLRSTITNGTTSIWSQSVSVASGAAATLTVPASVLVDETDYKVTVTADDSWSTASRTIPMRVSRDKLPPSSPTVESAVLGDGQIVDALPAGHAFVATSDEADASGFYVVKDGDDSAGQVATASGGIAQIPWAPGAGVHNLAVSAVDAAGNRGEPTQISFVVRQFNDVIPSALLVDVLLAPGEVKNVSLPEIPGVDWADVDSIKGTVMLSEWQEGVAGNVAVLNPLGESLDNATVLWAETSSPQTGAFERITFAPGGDDTVDLQNASSETSVRVKVSMDGWWRLYSTETDEFSEIEEADESSTSAPLSLTETNEISEPSTGTTCVPVGVDEEMCTTVSAADEDGLEIPAKVGSNGETIAPAMALTCGAGRWAANRFEMCSVTDVLVEYTRAATLLGTFKYSFGRRVRLGHLSNTIKMQNLIYFKRADGFFAGKSLKVNLSNFCEGPSKAVCGGPRSTDFRVGPFVPDDRVLFDHEFDALVAYNDLADFKIRPELRTIYPGAIETVLQKGLGRTLKIRCDRMSYFSQGAGCHVPSVRPTFFLSKSKDGADEAARFYENVQASYPWGVSGGNWFKRTTADNRRRNYLRSCRGLYGGVKKNFKKSCDEFPFASTEQGCWTNSANRYTCQTADVRIDHNKQAGRLLNTFFRRMRLPRISDADDEPFYFKVLP